ncbi:uncharacterized protein CMC5_007000 [Chondromyces crocatus]|uniref:Protein kinase domain-containing protein n=2 Tax=Chondromyces crocatus TaxID=52 RepID=A0A0K1E7D8_CHOCO|nr:uncharacterized protein CMC5_007000 [Chondromyces crocatus]
MGTVWAARNELTHRDFAIKVLLPELAQNREALQRFFQEARVCGQIRHPAVVDVFDVGQAEDGAPYIVMELLEGEGLDTRLKSAGALPPHEAAAWIAFVARGLEEAHVRGVVHRDLKPANVFLAEQPTGEIVPKILDFGVSKANGVRGVDHIRTLTGAVLGSPAYMSPEQASGEEEIDGRSDLWSLGVMLYEALTARHPFEAPNYNALMVAILSKPHEPVRSLAPAVSPELAAVVDRALIKDRDQRIGQARELAERLEAALAAMPSSLRQGPGGSGRGASGAPVSTPASGRLFGRGSGGLAGEVRRWPSRARGLAPLAAALGALLLAVGAVLMATQLRPIAPVVAQATGSLAGRLAPINERLSALKTELRSQEKVHGEGSARGETEEQHRTERAVETTKTRVSKPTPAPRRVLRGGVENPGF